MLGKSLLGVGDEVLGKNVEMAKLRLQRRQIWEREATEDPRTSVSQSPGHRGPGPGPREAALRLHEGHAPPSEYRKGNPRNQKSWVVPDLWLSWRSSPSSALQLSRLSCGLVLWSLATPIPTQTVLVVSSSHQLIC